ncbi:hypothetical protein ADUPG1_002156, partial [Aduncisulcus paluster]
MARRSRRESLPGKVLKPPRLRCAGIRNVLDYRDAGLYALGPARINPVTGIRGSNLNRRFIPSDRLIIIHARNPAFRHARHDQPRLRLRTFSDDDRCVLIRERLQYVDELAD